MFICALLAAGCSSGGGGDAFVASPGGGVPAGGGGTATGAGSVTFNFVKAQAPITVPVNTVQLRFEFFTGLEGTGSIAKREVRDFANTITIDNVPNNVQSSVVTAITADGFPVAQFTVNVSVPTNANVTVDGTAGTLVPVTPSIVASSPQIISLGNGDTLQVQVSVTFSNGDTVVLDAAQTAAFIAFVSDNPAVATVAADGTITAITDGTATITGTFSLGGTPVSITVTVGTGVQPPPTVVSIDLQTVEAQPVQLPVGTMSQPVTVVATLDDMTTQNLTQANGVVFTSSNGDVSVDANGQIVVAPTATAPDTAIVTATYTDPTNGALVDTVQVNVVDEVLQSLTANPASVSLPFGGFEQAISVTGNFSSGVTAQLIPGTTVIFTESSVNFSFVNDLMNNTALVTTAAMGTAGTDNLTATAATFSNNPSVDIPISVGLVTINSLEVTPSNVTNLIPGQVQSFTVLANLSDSTQVDVSDFAALMVSTVDANVAVADGRQVVGVGPGTTTATFTLAGTSFDVPVTVIAEQLTAISILFAGNEAPPDLTVNLPRGYVGIVEVMGTFNTGGTRKLRANEYAVEKSMNGSLPMGGPATLDEALTLLVPGDYSLTALNAEFNNAMRASYSAAGAVGPMVDSWNDSTAISNDLIGFLRTIATADMANPGSTTTNVRVRDTFKAIVADWRRGETIAGIEVDDGGGPAVQSVDTQRFFTININDNLIPTGDPNMLDNRQLSVTIVDPDVVTFVSADFVNYPDDNFVAVGSLREVDVRVNFSATVPGAGVREPGDFPTQGRAVSEIQNFRLAEANADLTRNGFDQVSTSIGWPGLSSDVPIQNALLFVDALPIGGFGGIPVNLIPPVYDPGTDTIPGTMDDMYTPGTYGISYDTFGPTFTPTTAEDTNTINPPTDPGPAPGFGQELTARAAVAPADTYTSMVATGNNGEGISVVVPVLFSIDPIDAGGVLNIGVGSSQIFRTVIQFAGDPAGLKDRSLDYPPTLFTGSPASYNSILVDDNTGRIQVSGIGAGMDVTAGDVDMAVGDGGILSGLIAGDLGASQGVVVALDAVTLPISPVGAFVAGVVEDVLGQAGPAEAVTQIDTGVAP